MPYYNLTTKRITFAGNDGDEIEAYYAAPSAAGAYPGVVLIHHLPGWDAWTREMVRRFAENGYATIAPHLFSRMAGETPEEQAVAARVTWGPPDADVMGDVAASARYLKAEASSNGRVGTIGFCSGGRHAFLAASQVKELDAAVDCWGAAVVPDDRWAVDALRPVSPIGATKEITMPVLGIFGNEDTLPTPAEVDTIEAELKRHGKTYEFHRYDGAGHGFWNHDRPAYRLEQTRDSWEKTLAFYARHLGSPAST